MSTDSFEKFLDEYKKALEDPLIKHFLKNTDNYNLLKMSINNPTEGNKRKVEESFARHHNEVRTYTYFNNLIKYFSIDFDKKIRKDRERNQLTLDQTIPNSLDGVTTFKDLIPDEKETTKKETDSSLLTEVVDENLHNALSVLTDLQYNVLELTYVNKLSTTEIAEKLGKTTQNICNTHRKALVKLKNYIKGD